MLTAQDVPVRGNVGRRVAIPHPVTLIVVLGTGLVLANLALTAPQAPGPQDHWRWLTLTAALPLCAWNVTCACRSYRQQGLVSVIGFLHLWTLFAFSFPALEGTYRYDVFQTALWTTPTNAPLVFQAVLLIALFQLLFFSVLGRATGHALAGRLRGSRATGPDRRLALVFLVLLAPLLLARLIILRDLGLQGAIATAVSRVNYFDKLESQVNPVVWLLNGIFPILAVSLCCLCVKYLVPHPSRLGQGLYVVTLFGCIGGVALSGGRADLAYVAFTVVVFMYVSGYRTFRHLTPLLVPMVAVALLLFLVAQARTGGSNALSDLAGDPYGDYSSYAGGDISQVLGMGRFDAVVMILDRHELYGNLSGKSYVYALAGALNTTFLPRIALGEHLPLYHVSDAVLGPWVFGEAKSSALPSAPGELYLNFGVLGVVCGALVLGLCARLLLHLVAGLPGSVEFAAVLVVWTLARFLSDESYVVATFAARNWPFMLMTLLVLRGIPTSSTSRNR